MTSTKLEEIYQGLNESEKFGLCFGLFPYRLKEKLDKDEIVELMEMALDRENVDLGAIR